MNILITGATGFIGTALIKAFQKKNNHISILTRDKTHVSQNNLNVFESFESIDEIPSNAVFDVIINLAGAPISKRWTRNYKKKLIESRVSVTHSIYDLVKKLDTKPKIMLSASAVGYYGNQDNKTVLEDSEPHNEFTHQLCSLWEQEALALKTLGVHVIIIRLGVVLGRNGGMLKETSPIFKMGLGGKLGTGKQYLSWVHIDDVVQAIQFLLTKTPSSAIYNLTAPYPVTNAYWTKTLANALKRPALLPLPASIVKIVFGEMGNSLLLNGQKVLPKRLEDAGFSFQYPKLKAAFLSIF
jgi:uncharacterized protein